MNISPAGISLITMAVTARHLPRRSYVDDLGRLCCGYGHVLKLRENVQLPLSHDLALKLLYKDLEPAHAWANANLPALKQHQFDSVICWLFQAMDGQCRAKGQTWAISSLVAFIQHGSMQLAAAEFDNWVFVNERLNRHLVSRRQAEQRLFLTGETVCG